MPATFVPPATRPALANAAAASRVGRRLRLITLPALWGWFIAMLALRAQLTGPLARELAVVGLFALLWLAYLQLQQYERLCRQVRAGQPGGAP